MPKQDEEANKQFKRVVLLGDLHCGHFVGLTPPAWWQKQELADIQEKLWGFYEDTIQSLGHIDVVLCNGDAIDGDGGRSGATELIERDLERQAEMAYDCLSFIKADNYIMTYGTPYHVANNGSDTERQIAKELNCKIGGHEWFDVNGVIFDAKHKVGSSSIPHGRSTAINKENLWNQLWSDEGTNPRSNVIVRSHVHYHQYSGDADCLAMTLPALQGPGSKFGVRQCSGIVHFGLVHFDVYETGEYTWKSHILKAVVKQEAVQF